MNTERYIKLQYLKRCSFGVGSWDKQFVRSLAEQSEDYELTYKQAYQIDRLYWHYRRQIEAMVGTDKPEFFKPGEPIEDDEPPVRIHMPFDRPDIRARNQQRKLERAQAKLDKWNKNAGG